MSYWGVQGSARRFDRLILAIRYAKELAPKLGTLLVSGFAGDCVMEFKVHPDGSVERHRREA